jgi:hypothetical protein
MLILPIANDVIHKQFLQEIKAIQEEIDLQQEDALAHKAELIKLQQALQMEVDDYQKKQQPKEVLISPDASKASILMNVLQGKLTRENINDYLINNAVGVGWTTILMTALSFKTALDAATLAGRSIGEMLSKTSKIIGLVLFPIHFAIDGLRSLWTLYNLSREKMIGRNARVLATIVNFVAIGGAAVVTALAIANPFLIPAIFMVVMAAGIFKCVSESRQLSKAIKIEKATIEKLSQEIDELKKDLTKPNPVKMNRLAAQLARHESQREQLAEQRFHARRELVFTAVSTAAVVMLIVGVIFPPVALAGLFLFAAAGIVNVIDSLNGFKASKAIQRTYNRI